MATIGVKDTKVVISAPSSTPITGIEILSTSFPFPTITTTELGLVGGGVINASDPQWGIIGDGVADDAPAINNMSAYAVANGYNKIVFASNKTYRVASAILPRQNLIWDGQGCTILETTFIAGGMFHNPTESTPTKTFIGDLTADFVGPSDQLTLTSVAGLAVGNWVGVGIGLNPYAQTAGDFVYAVVVQVTAIVGSTITIDWVIPYSIPIGAYTYVPHNPSLASVPVVSCPSGAKSVWLLHIVTDATAVVVGSIVAGTGANTVPVFSDGTNWRIG